jgi:hypothetical protein
MKKTIFTLVLLCALPVMSVLGQDTGIRQTAVTVYNSNIAVVKETRGIEIPKGSSLVNFMNVAQQIDPTTVRIKFDGTVVEQNYKYDLVSLDKILQRYVDKKIQLIDQKGELIEGTLLSADRSSAVLKKPEGGLTLLSNLSSYRIAVGELPEGLITRPTLQCLLNSNKAGKQDAEISYQTSGVSWHAEYVAVLDKDDQQLDLNAWVTIENNSGTTFNNAAVKVVAGEIHRANQNGTYAPRYEKVMSMQAGMAANDAFKERGLFEYHAYELERKTTIANNETKQIELFSKAGIHAEKRFEYFANESTGEAEDNVVTKLFFENKTANNIGIPLPAGTVRIFKMDAGALELIGEDAITHTPVDGKVNLELGNAFEIKAKTRLMNQQNITNRIVEYTYKITLMNHKDAAVSVKVRKALYGDWSITTTTDEYGKEDANTATFQVKIPARSDKEITFTVRVKS